MCEVTTVGAIRAKLAAWKRQYPRLVLGGLIVVGTLLCWAGYRVERYYEARSHYRAAQQAVEQREWKTALDRLQESQRIEPNNPATYLLAARAERRLENLDNAKKQLDICQRLQGGE